MVKTLRLAYVNKRWTCTHMVPYDTLAGPDNIGGYFKKYFISTSAKASVAELPLDEDYKIVFMKGAIKSVFSLDQLMLLDM
jgi:hypothetical protein